MTHIYSLIIYDHQNYFAFKLVISIIIQENKICMLQPRIIGYVLYRKWFSPDMHYSSIQCTKKKLV